MEEQQPYDPGAYRRLELVRKQFQRDAAEQKIQQSAQKRRALADWLAGHKPAIVRWTAYVIMGALMLTIISFIIAEALH